MATKQFTATIINVSQPTFTKTAKGGYNKIEVTYKQGKEVQGKPIVDFDTKEVPNQKEIFDFCKTLKEGDKVNVTSEKGEKYWNWTAVTRAAESETGLAEGTGTAESDSGVSGGDAGDRPTGRASSQTRGRVTGSNYETPTERATRQVYIARQSSLERALDLVIHNSQDGQIDPKAVIEVAKIFEEYVQSPVTKDGIPF